MLMLGDQSSGISFAAARIRSICAGSKPVVANTSGSLFRRQVSRIASAALGTEKSMTTSTGTSNSAAKGTPKAPAPAMMPASSPKSGVVRRFQGRGHRQLRIGRAEGDQAAAHAAGRAVNGDANAVTSLQ